MTVVPKVRAQCGSAARWDLCGGHRVNRCPYRDPTGYEYASRRRELALRLAVGAAPWRLASRLAREACLGVAIGTAVGLLSYWTIARLLEATTFSVSSLDLVSVVSAAVLLGGTVVVAAAIQCLRAVRLDIAAACRDQ